MTRQCSKESDEAPRFGYHGASCFSLCNEALDFFTRMTSKLVHTLDKLPERIIMLVIRIIINVINLARA